jgi:hypothetical protein
VYEKCLLSRLDIKLPNSEGDHQNRRLFMGSVNFDWINESKEVSDDRLRVTLFPLHCPCRNYLKDRSKMLFNVLQIFKFSQLFVQFYFQSDRITHLMYPTIKSRFIFGCPMDSLWVFSSG